MDRLWAPWRIEYILGPKPDDCLFCIPDSDQEDGKRLILHRDQHVFAIMNGFPYNNGHLMVAPYRHVSCLTGLKPEEGANLMELLKVCTQVLSKALSPEGINIGLNLGQAAGAGIEAHLHWHLVPRWNGDHSFMAVCSETMVIPEHLHSTYARLKPYFQTLS